MDLSDKLLSFHERLVKFLDRYLRTILTLIALFIFVGLLWGGFTYYKSKKEKEASLKLMEVVKEPNIIQALKDVKEKYRGTQAALQANLLLLNYYFQQKNYNEAQKLIDELKKEYPKKVEGIILYGKAKILENQGELSKALEIYQKIPKIQPELNFLTYIDIARIAEKLGNFDLSKEYYQKYIKEPFSHKNVGFAEYKLNQLDIGKR